MAEEQSLEVMMQECQGAKEPPSPTLISGYSDTLGLRAFHLEAFQAETDETLFSR